ncbi:MAG: hypothetical protein QX198_13945 [Methylococcaceae bacterium]
MNTETIKVKLNIQELDIPWMRIEFKGKLFAATPARSKPRGMSPETWVISLLHARSQFGKFRIAIPRSFWPSNAKDLIENAGMCPADWIDVMDVFSGTENLDGLTPVDSIQTIIGYLKRGDDVVILSATKKVSGFIPAILSKTFDSHVHIVKVWYPIVYGREYELSPFQYGYIYGQSDASWLESMRKDISNDKDDFYKKDDHDKTQYCTEANNSELEVLVAEVRSLLESIGQALFQNEIIEIRNLVEQLGECEKHPAIEESDTVHLGFNSIIYRLCDVMKGVTKEGQNALAELDIAALPIDEFMPNIKAMTDFSETEKLKHELHICQQHILSIADMLWHIGSIDLSFLSCDLSVLIEHPEVAKVSDLVSSLREIQNQLGDIEGRLEDMAEMIRQYKIVH